MVKINFQNLHGEECDIMLVDELFDSESPEFAIIEDLYRTSKLLPNSCAENSKAIMETLNEYYGYKKVMFVEGYAVDSRNKKTLHCWNVIDGHYFDVTAKYFWGTYRKYKYHAHRLFDEDQYSHFLTVGKGLNISMGELLTPDLKYKLTFGNMGMMYKIKISKKELERKLYEYALFEYNIDQYLSIKNAA